MAPSVMAGIPALKETTTRSSARAWTKLSSISRPTSAPSAPAAPPSTCSIRSKSTTTARRRRSTRSAQITTPDANLIVIQPWDASLIVEIEKSLRTSDLGFNPNNDGKIVRVPVPPMTEERRREVVKHLHRVLEDHRTAVRNIRRDGNDLIKKAAKDKKISEDEEKRSLDEIQKLTDEEIKKMEEMAKKKEAEVMQV